MLYVLDEPSIGLHPRDNQRLLETLERLRDLGNTVLVVEHDEETIRRADYVIDLGPGRGQARWIPGGLRARRRAIAACLSSLTGQYLSGKRHIPIPATRRAPNGKFLSVLGARANNLKNIDVQFPLGLLTVVTGVSGSGKSTLVNDILYRALAKKTLPRHRRAGAAPRARRARSTSTRSSSSTSRPSGGRRARTPPPTPACSRRSASSLPCCRNRASAAIAPGRFSFNVKGGRCEACQGDGLRRIEMNFLPDVYVTCEVCRGRRYNSETLAVKYKGCSIADLLDMTVADALPLLENIPQIKQKLQTLVDVGLGYIHLGQPATTLSGGEAQRIKLARELSRRQTGRTLYILDEPTTGLHFDDVKQLLAGAQSLDRPGQHRHHHRAPPRRRRNRPTGSSTWGPKAARRAAASSPRGRPKKWRAYKKSFTGQALAAVLNGSHKMLS